MINCAALCERNWWKW